jgi:hypothetical protein
MVSVSHPVSHKIGLSARHLTRLTLTQPASQRRASVQVVP